MISGPTEFLCVFNFHPSPISIYFVPFPTLPSVSALLHPSTYINKILFGSHQGRMQLWNIKSNKLIYSFAGWDAGVTVLTQAPAIDVAAVGLADGRIVIHNLRWVERRQNRLGWVGWL